MATTNPPPAGEGRTATASAQPARPFELSTMFVALRRRVLLIGLCGAVGAALGVVFVAMSSTSYTSTAVVRVEPMVVDVLDPGSIGDAGTLPGLYAEVTTTNVLTAAQGRIGPAVSVQALREAVTVSQIERGPILRISATMESEELAVLAADAVASAYVADRSQRFRADIDAARARLAGETSTVAAQLADPDSVSSSDAEVLSVRLAELARQAVRLDYAQTFGGEIVTPAREPAGPDGVPAVLTVAAAAILALGLAIAWAIDRERRRVSASDLDQIFGDLHVDIPAEDLERRLRDGALPSERLEHSVRELRSRLRAAGTERVLMMSLTAGPTASWLVAVLADLQARFGEPTRVIDFDTDQLEQWVGQSEGVMVASAAAIAEPSTADGSQLVVAAPAIDADPLGLEAARHADTVVLVVDEADHRSDVSACVDRLHAAGARRIAAARLVTSS